MIAINESHLQSTKGHAYPLRSLSWSGAPILDACTVRAKYGHLLLLTSGGALAGVNCDTGTSSQLCVIELPQIENADYNGHFGPPAFKLHASSDGRFAAIVADRGRHGIVVDTHSGKITMRLDGGDYCEETVPFSACFLLFDGYNVFVHRTAWNRLDAADPVTGKTLTKRHIEPYRDAAKERPAHYLDYFHGQLRPSPDGSRIFDDGWVWHPVSIPRSWSIADWLRSNPWESEDGASVVELPERDDWTTPVCWISDRHIALWGLAGWSGDEHEESERSTGLRVLDTTEKKQPSIARWTMEIEEKRVLSLLSDRKRLFVTTDTETMVWDIASRTRITELPGFVACLNDSARNTLISIRSDAIVELLLE
jgi:hypothetical protein